jgi:hypothetical protein
LLLGIAVSLPSDRGFAASVQQASELKSVQQKLGVSRTSWGSFRETRIVLGGVDHSRKWGSFSEARQVLERARERDRLYVKDCGYAFFRAVQRSTPS